MVDLHICDKIDKTFNKSVVEYFPYKAALEISESQIAEGKAIDAQESIDKLRLKYGF